MGWYQGQCEKKRIIRLNGVSSKLETKMEGPIVHPLPVALLMIDLYLNIHMIFWSLLEIKLTEGQSGWELEGNFISGPFVGTNTVGSTGSVPTCSTRLPDYPDT